MTPTLAIANDLTGTSVTATVAGDPGATHTLYYRAFTGSVQPWTPGVSRVGDGAVQQTGLTARVIYEFLCVSSLAGVLSLPSTARFVLTATATPPIVDLIATEIQTKLLQLVAAGVLTAAQRPARVGIPEGIGDKSAVLLQGDTREDDEQLHGYKCWVTPFEIYLCLRPSDTDTAAVDAGLNLIRAQVERKLIEDFTAGDPLLGGYADNVTIQEPANFTLGEAIAGVIVNLDVHYRHIEGDPFTQ